MCKNPEKSAAAFLEAAQPEVTQLITVLGEANTPAGKAFLAEYAVAITDLQNWVPGDTTKVIGEVIQTLDDAFNALPVPDDAKGLAGLVDAAIQSVLAIIEANTPHPAVATAATPEEGAAIQEVHAMGIAHDTEKKITQLTGFTPSVLDKARVKLGDTSVIPKHWKQLWKNEAVKAAAVNPDYATLVEAQ